MYYTLSERVAQPLPKVNRVSLLGCPQKKHFVYNSFTIEFMSFNYVWKNKEANFDKPLKRQVRGGTHITFEIILKWNGKYVALRRQSIPGHERPPRANKYPNGLLYFCHNLIRYGESVEHCVKRIVKSQAGVGIKSYKVVDIESSVQKKDDQWAVIPLVIAELKTKPKEGSFGNHVSEVVAFTRKNVPNDFAWWEKSEVEYLLNKFDKNTP